MNVTSLKSNTGHTQQYAFDTHHGEVIMIITTTTTAATTTINLYHYKITF